MRTKLLHLFVALALTLSLFGAALPVAAEESQTDSRAPGITFSSATFFGGSDDQRGTGIDISGSDIYLSGSGPGYELDGLVVQYSLPLGSPPVWSAFWPNEVGTTGYNTDEFFGVMVSGDGVYLAGWGKSFAYDPAGGIEEKAYLVKFPLTGATGLDVGGSTWYDSPNFSAYYGGENFRDAAVAEEGGTTYIYTTGYAQESSYNASIIAKYGTAGNHLNSAYYVGTAGSVSYNHGIVVLNSNIYVVGNSSSGDGTGRPVLTKYDSDLIQLWRQRPTELTGRFLGVTAFGGAIYTVGNTRPGDAGSEDYLIQKYDEAGNIVWSQTSGGANTDVLTDIVSIGSRLFAVGYTKSSGAGGADAVIMEIDPTTGNTLSTTLYGGAEDDMANGVATDGTDIYVVGESRSYANAGNAVGQNDLMLLRYITPATIYVPGNYSTIQAAIDAASPGGTILVAAGTYNEDITLKDGVNLQGAGANVTTIDGGGSGTVVSAYSVGSGTKLDGFTITNGQGSSGPQSIQGGGIFLLESTITISNCIISGNAAGFGGGIFSRTSVPTITNTIIANNSAGSQGGGIWHDGVGGAPPASFINCTITGNQGPSVYFWYGEIEVSNTIIWDSIYHASSGVHLTITYSDIQGGEAAIGGTLGTVTWGVGNIALDPLFVDAAGGDYHLQSGSPCIDAGTNTGAPPTDFEGDDRIIDGDGDTVAVVDMGADEYVPPAVLDQWTFMVYMCADNNLNDAGIDDLNEMEVAGSTANVNIVALLDLYGDANTNIYYVTHDEDPNTINSPIVLTNGDLNMGDPFNVTGFVEWTIANYPANHYALVLWDHGSGWRTRATSEMPLKGVCFDDTSMDYIDTPELGAALATINTDTGVTLDIVGFDACLMEMVEVAYQIQDYADIMVGSEEVEPGDGWPYDTILTDLTTTPSILPETLATTIVTQYMAYYGAYGTGIETMSAVDLAEIPTLATAINTLADSMVTSGEWQNIVIARTNTELFYYPDYVDLYHFAQNVQAQVTDTTVQANAAAVMNAVTNSVIAEGHGSYHPNAHGLSIYFPISGAIDANYSSLAFASGTWDEFLAWYLTPQVPTWTEILTDPIGDQFEGVGPDIVGVDSSLSTDTIAFQARMNEAIDFSNFMGATALDTDQNPATPFPETGGFEYYVFVGTQMPGGGGSGSLDKFDIDLSKLDIKTRQGGEPWAILISVFGTGPEDWEWIAMLPLFTGTNSYWTIIPLSLLGSDDGNMDVIQLVGTATPEQWTDSVPEMGPPPEEIHYWTLIEDPEGDGYPDIYWVGAFRRPDMVGFMVNGAFDVSDLVAVTWLDTDQEPGTGDPINDIGADYKVTVYTAASLNATLASWNGTAWVDVGPIEVYTDNTSWFDVKIPLSDLGDDQGNMDVVQTIGTFSVEVTDIAPNEGHRSIDEPPWIELFSDPTGDSTGTGPDLVGVDAERDEKSIAFRVRAEGIDFANLAGDTYLDIDSDNTTGQLVNDIGADYVARVTTGTSLNGWLGRWNGTAWEDAGGFGVYTDGNYYWFHLDFGHHLGGDEGEMDIVQVIGPLTPEEWSDKAPDEGHGTSPPPRIEEEWWDEFIHDPEGDGYPDIHVVGHFRHPDKVGFRVRGTFDFDNLKAVTHLDIDQNNTTGKPIHDIGSDYIVTVVTSGSLQGSLCQWNEAESRFDIVGAVDVYTDIDCFWFQIPLSDLGGDQGNMDVVQVVGTVDTFPGAITDIAPDEGHGTIGEPQWFELFSDPTGDLLAGTAPDLTGVDISRHSQGIAFRVRADGINFANLAGDTYIDIDQNPTTGYSSGGYFNDIGAEYKAVVRSSASLQGALFYWDGAAWQEFSGFGVFRGGNYYWFWLGYGQLGDDEGNMDVVQVIGTLSPEVWTDKTPNEGHGSIGPRATVEEAIADGTEWLASNQNPDGSWGTQYPLAKAGLAVLKLETHAADLGLSPFDSLYEYHAQVQSGLDYIFANAHIRDIWGQPAGDPDSDGDGIGVLFRSPEEGFKIYETSIVMMAIAASTDPTRVVNVPGSPVHGWTYSAVLQDAVDYIAWGQTDWGFGRGGWNYEPNEDDDRSDQSNSGWATLGLAYAESPSPIGFGLPIPGFVRSELRNYWIDYIQNDVDGDEHDGGADYTGPGCPYDELWVNMLKTGNLLQQMAFVGDTLATPRVQDAIDYLVRHWDEHHHPGWKGWPSCYHTTYTTMKGLEAFNLDTIDTINWFQDFVDALLQEQNPDGSWPSSSWDDGEQMLSTEWALLTLQKTTAPTMEKPDLVISEKHEEWVNEELGTYQVYFTIKNRGNAVAPGGGHHMGITIDEGGEPIPSPFIDVALAPGESYSGFFDTVITLSGVKDEITVYVDAENAIDELNEDNNCRTNTWPPKDWTFMVYMSADNELEGAAWSDINEMEWAGSTDNVNIIVLRDGPHYWDSEIYYIVHDEEWGPTPSPVVNHLGEVNMGDPQTLVNFVEWTIDHYQADHYALILWDRVGDYKAAWRTEEAVNIRGVCVDQHSENDYLTTPEIGSALGTILSDTGFAPNLIGFDTSLMALVEVDYEIATNLPGEHVIVASQELEFCMGWAYAHSLTALIGNPAMTPTQLASQIVNDYVNFYQAEGWDWATLSAVNSGQVPALATAIDSFAQAMKNSLEAGIEAKIRTARDQAQRFWFNQPTAPYVDLYHFAHHVKLEVTDTAVHNSAQAVMDAIVAARVAEGHLSFHDPGADGISIYYPSCLEMYQSDYPTGLAFTANTQWDEFLSWILLPDTTPPPIPTLVSPGDGTEASPAPVLEWNQVGDASGVSYSLQVDDDPGFGSPVVGETGLWVNTVRVTPPLAVNTYYWKVMAVDGVGNPSGWSAVWSFDVTQAPKWSYVFQPAHNRMLFGQSVAIADLGVNTNALEPDTDLEIATGSDECGVYNPELETWVLGAWRVLDSTGDVEWAKDTESDQANTSAAIADLDGDGSLEIIGGTTSGETVEVMDKHGNFVWTFPSPPRSGNRMWHSSPAVADVNPAVGGLEVIIGNRALNTIFCFDGDNSDGVDEGISASDIDWGALGEGTHGWEGNEGTDWDILWIYTVNGWIFSTPAIGDVDNDGQLEVVFGAGYEWGAEDGKIYCLNGADGSLEWSYQTAARGIDSSAGLADFDNDGDLEVVVGGGADDGRVYFINNNGDAVIDDATEVNTLQTGGPVHSSPSIGDVDSDGNLEVVIGSNDGNVYCLAYDPVANTVTEKWRFATGGPVYSSAALVNRGGGDLAIYISSCDGWLYILDGTTGSALDKFFVGVGIRSSPSVADIDGDGVLEVIFADWAPLPPEGPNFRGDGQTLTREPSDYEGSSDVLWCFEDTGASVDSYAIEWPMFRNNAERTGLYPMPEVPELDLIVTYKYEEWVDEGAGTYTVHYVIKNVGNAEVPAGHDVGLTVDSVGKEQKVVPEALAPNATYSDSFDTVLTLDGTDEITVCADFNNEVGEADETNNCLTNTWPPAGVVVSINAPDRVPEDYDFTVTVDITTVIDLNAVQYDISFDPSVLRLDDITAGQIDSTAFLAMFNEISPGTFRVVQSMGLGTVSGSGYLSVLHFHVIGSMGESSTITLSNGILMDINEVEIQATWIGDFIEVSVIPGDANGDGIVTVADMTRVARIILMLTAETPGADANQDGLITVADMTRVARIILQLYP